MLVADRFRPRILADRGIEPPTRILAARFPRQRHTPFAEALFQEIVVQTREVADLSNAQRMQIALRNLAHARHLSHIERSEKGRLAPRQYPEHAVGLRLVRADLRH